MDQTGPDLDRDLIILKDSVWKGRRLDPEKDQGYNQ